MKKAFIFAVCALTTVLWVMTKMELNPDVGSESLPKVSIVMAFLNRRHLCEQTLKSIMNSKEREHIEVIIVDDGSNPEEALDPAVLGEFPFPIHLWAVEKTKKHWINPVVAYNFGLSKARGDWVIIQNPGVLHIGDVISELLKLSKENYHVFKCFASKNASVNTQMTDLLSSPQRFAQRFFNDIENTGAIHNDDVYGMWLAHPRYRDKPFHFLSAIYRKKLALIGGFNPAMRNGFWYDDDEILVRLRRVLSVKWTETELAFGLHLWHPRDLALNGIENPKPFMAKNRKVLKQIQNNETCVFIDPEIELFGPLFSKIF